MSEKLSNEHIAALRDGCEGVTPGEWEYYSHEPGGWRAPESPAAMVNSNGDKVIDCTWACATEYGERTYRHIANCDPDTIRALATEVLESRATIEAQAARIEVLEGALRRIEHEAIIRKPENAAQTVDDLRALARAALGGNDAR